MNQQPQQNADYSANILIMLKHIWADVTGYHFFII